MNIGEKIAKARKDKGLTQAELGNATHVTFQAVSKWERGESVPDFGTICDLAKVLGVPITYFSEDENAAEAEVKAQVAPALDETPRPAPEYKPVLAVCEKCNRPIFNGGEIVRYFVGDEKHIKCTECDRKEKKAKLAKDTENGKRRRIHSFIWSALAAVIGIVTCACTLKGDEMIFGIIGSAMLFPFISCLILYNNFVGEMVVNIIEWSAVTFPGIIFSFDIDGFLFLIAMKILFFIISVILTILCFMFAVIVGSVVSVFVYPYAIVKNFKHPECGEYAE